MTTKSWLDIASEITQGDRQRDYSHPLINFLRHAMLLNVMYTGKLKTDVLFTPVDVAMQMIVLKQARQLNTHKADNWIDTMGYAACVESMNDLMLALGYTEGVEAFSDMTLDEMQGVLIDAIEFTEAQQNRETPTSQQFKELLEDPYGALVNLVNEAKERYE